MAIGSYEDISDRFDLTDFVKQEEIPELFAITPPEEPQNNDDDLSRLLTSWDMRQRELMSGPSGKKAKSKGGKKSDKQLLLSEDKVDEIHKLGKVMWTSTTGI